jgi:hypothetical protein
MPPRDPVLPNNWVTLALTGYDYIQNLFVFNGL